MKRETLFLLAKLKTLLQKTSLIGVGCTAHVFNDCIRTAVEILELDFENVIYKTYPAISFLHSPYRGTEDTLCVYLNIVRTMHYVHTS
jgi:hypothetical protein